MGAIAGIIYPEIFPVTYAIRPALNAMRYRDGSETSTTLFKNMELGTRGNPIAFNHNRTLAALVDGTFDNAPQLTEELRHAGVPLHNPDAAQLAVHAYDVWGPDFVRRVKGPFAIAIGDLHKHQLLLMRDRVGVKPLYWAYYNNYFIFASELKGILATGLIPQTAAPEGIAAYLNFGYIPQDLSPIQHVNKLLPCFKLQIGPDTPLSVTPYWSYSAQFAATLIIDPDDAESELQKRLRSAMQRERASVKEVSFTSNSGLGSGYLASYLSESTLNDNTVGLSVDYAALNEQDVEFSADICRSLLLPHTSVTVEPSRMIASLPTLAWHLDEPVTTPSSSGIYALYQLAMQRADTLFADAGTESILATHCPDGSSGKTGRGGKFPLLKAFLPLLLKIAPTFAYEKLYEKSLDPWLCGYLKAQELFPQSMLNRISPNIGRLFNPDIFIQRFYELSKLGAGRSAQMYLDVKMGLVDRDILMHDRLSCAAGMQWHSPFLDDDVITFMAQLPDKYKFPDDAMSHPLAKMVQRTLPNRSFHRPISRSATFLNPWIYDAGFNRVIGFLLDGTLVESGWISRDWLEKAISQQSQTSASFQQLWALLALEMWFQIFINRPIGNAPPSASTAELLGGRSSHT